MKTPLDHGAFKKRVSTGEATFGIFLGLATPMAIEIAAIAGMDWVLLDLEHGPMGEDQVGSVVTTAGAYGITSLVRVESDDRIRINRVLDAGIAGVMVPRVESAAQVREAVSHFSTPPFGDRGVATYNFGDRNLDFLMVRRRRPASYKSRQLARWNQLKKLLRLKASIFYLLVQQI